MAGLAGGSTRVLTGGVVFVREVEALFGARHEGAPEEAAVHALSQAGDVDMAVHAALLKGLREGGIVDVVVVQRPNVDGDVIVPV